MRVTVPWLVKAIHIMYKNLVVNPLSWQHPRRAQVPWPGGRGTRREGRLVQHLLGTQGGREEVLMAPPDTKNGENSLNTGTELRLSPDLCRAAVQSAVGGAVSSSVSFVCCSS